MAVSAGETPLNCGVAETFLTLVQELEDDVPIHLPIEILLLIVGGS